MCQLSEVKSLEIDHATSLAFIANLPKLADLSLNSPRLNRDEFLRLQTSKSIDHLTIRNATIGDMDAASLLSLTSLTQIAIQSCDIADSARMRLRRETGPIKIDIQD